MIVTLYIIAGILAAFAGFAIWMYLRGRQAQQGADALKTDKVQDEQLEAANQRRDADAVLERLRKHDF